MTKYTKPDHSEQLASAGVTLQGYLMFRYQHQTKILVYKGSNVCKEVG